MRESKPIIIMRSTSHTKGKRHVSCSPSGEKKKLQKNKTHTTQEPYWCFTVSANDSQPLFLEWVAAERRKKAGKRSLLLAGTESVRAWVG